MKPEEKLDVSTAMQGCLDDWTSVTNSFEFPFSSVTAAKIREVICWLCLLRTCGDNLCDTYSHFKKLQHVPNEEKECALSSER